MRRRSFLGWAGLLVGGVLAHHRPGHRGGPPAPTTTTAALPTTTTEAPMPTSTTVRMAATFYDVLVLTSDSNATAQGKIDAAASTAIIGFEAGTHLERKITPKLGQTLRGDPHGTTVFDGSRPVTGWTGSSPWVASHTIADRSVFIDSPTRSADPGDQYPEELFFETVGVNTGWTRKHREGNPSTSTPAAGGWTISYAAGTLRVTENPTAVNVRVSVTDKAIVSPGTGAGGLVIEDITFAKYATETFLGPAGQGTDHRDWIFRRCAMLDNHGVGAYFGPGDSATACRFAYNGQFGIDNECELGGYVAGQRIVDCEIAYNMRAKYDWGWGGGGSKFDVPTANPGLLIRNCWWHHNQGPGIWTDINTTETSDTVIESNLVEDNEIAGIFIEIGNNPTLVRWNRSRNNGVGSVANNGGPAVDAESGAGIDISNSRACTVQQNVVDTCRTGIIVRDDDRSPTLNGANVTDNSVKATDGNTVKFRPGAGSGPIATCGADSNRYWSGTFSYNNVFGMSFADWKAARTGPGLTGALDPNGTGGLSDPVTDPSTFVPFVALSHYGPG